MKKALAIILILIELFFGNVIYGIGEIEINARSAVVYDRKYKKVLYEKDMHKKVPNASTTKMLTAIVAYENADMDEIVTVSKKAANTTRLEGRTTNG